MLEKGEIKKQERKNEKDMIGFIDKLNVVDQEAKVQKKKTNRIVSCASLQSSPSQKICIPHGPTS